MTKYLFDRVDVISRVVHPLRIRLTHRMGRQLAVESRFLERCLQNLMGMHAGERPDLS